MRRIMTAIILVFLVGAIVYGNDAPTQDYWPVGEWRGSTPEEQGLDSEVLAAMFNEIRETGAKINSVTIIRHGYQVTEAYAFPYQKGLPHVFASCTKSVLSALVGIAVEEGYIKSVNDKVLDYFPGLQIANLDQGKRELRIRDLLTMSTGLDWQFSTGVSTGQMLQSADWTKFTLNLPMRETPGQSFNYCNGAAQVISAIIQRATGKTAWEYAKEKLPLGIRDMYWLSSPENVSSGWSGIYMQPTDMAKFGYLYLQGGRWNGRQLIPAAWLQESTQARIKANWTPLLPSYGYMWWINRFGGYTALGDGGNYLFVLPERQLVVVFSSALIAAYGRNLFLPLELMEKYILPAIKADGALKPNPAGLAALNKAVAALANPSPKSVPPLPPLARKISGQTYLLENGGNCMFTFDQSGECRFEQWPQYSAYQIGLDDAFRVNDTGGANGELPDHNHTAYKGEWVDGQTFHAIQLVVESGVEMEYTFNFDKDKVEIIFYANHNEFARLRGKLAK